MSEWRQRGGALVLARLLIWVVAVWFPTAVTGDDLPPTSLPRPSASPTLPADPGETSLAAGASGSSVDLAARRLQAAAASGLGPGTTPAGRVIPPLVQSVRAEVCGVLSAGVGQGWPCPDGRVLDHSDVCGDAPVLLPLWRQTRSSAADPWQPWVLVEGVTCVGGAVPSAEQVLAEFRELPIGPSVVTVQPDRGWVLVNKETIAYTDPASQVLGATVLGVPVTFQVTASSFTWDYGEKVFTTTSPGHPYPHQDVSYPYTHLGTGRVTLTTTWQATYTVGDDPTVRPVPGTATTTSTSAPFEIREATAHLTRGSCTDHPHDPGC